MLNNQKKKKNKKPNKKTNAIEVKNNCAIEEI